MSSFFSLLHFSCFFLFFCFFLHVFHFFFVSCFLLFFFLLFFVFPIFLLFCFSFFIFSTSFSTFFLVPVVRADAKIRKKSSRKSYCNKDCFLWKYDFLGLGGHEREGLEVAHLRVTLRSCFFFFFFLFFGAENMIFLVPQLLHEFLKHFFSKKSKFLSRLGEEEVHLWGLFSFFSFFLMFFFFFKKKIFPISLFLIFFFEKCVSFFFYVFAASSFLYQGFTKDVSSVVGAPGRCGVLTTQGGIAGIGLATYLGESMIQLPRVEWRLLARSNGASQDCIVVMLNG